jgi:hypothetical protein
MNFGSDFNSSKPEDSGFVRHPSLRQLATEIRDLKTRIVSFFSTCFNLSTGNLNSASIPMTALIESKDKPSSGNLGYYEVTVNAKGFVVSGNVNPPSAATSIFRAVFIGDEGFIETPTGTIKQTTTSSEIYGVPCPAFTDINSTRSSKVYCSRRCHKDSCSCYFRHGFFNSTSFKIQSRVPNRPWRRVDDFLRRRNWY